MNVTTQRDLIRSVAKRWRDAYTPFEQWETRPTFFGVPDKRAISKKLDNLDAETATADDVAAIIGNESWTRLTCDECGKDVDAVLTVGQKPDYDSHTASLCRACVARAASIFE